MDYEDQLMPNDEQQVRDLFESSNQVFEEREELQQSPPVPEQQQQAPAPESQPEQQPEPQQEEQQEEGGGFNPLQALGGAVDNLPLPDSVKAALQPEELLKGAFKMANPAAAAMDAAGQLGQKIAGDGGGKAAADVAADADVIYDPVIKYSIFSPFLLFFHLVFLRYQL